MSIPSTQTATLPPIHNSYHYSNSSRHEPYHSSHSYDPNRNPVSRLAPSYSNYSSHHPPSNPRTTTTSSSRAPPPSLTMGHSHTGAGTQPSSRRDRRPDWEEFYKNGIPEEVIVIGDTPEPPKPEARINYTTRTVPRADGTPEHASKKRRTGPANNINSRNFSYSNMRPVEVEDSGSNTVSTDRTTSLHTTAPTSLGSHGSHGSSANYNENQVVGQKRKRLTRQQVAAEAKKKKEIDNANDAFYSYVPPPKPPIKAKEVQVPPIRDVSDLIGWI